MPVVDSRGLDAPDCSHDVQISSRGVVPVNSIARGNATGPLDLDREEYLDAHLLDLVEVLLYLVDVPVLVG